MVYAFIREKVVLNSKNLVKSNHVNFFNHSKCES